ncbi:cytochrome P450 [Xylariaceae sp. FL0255]|nr:cytochrome P450 [Xylariaceae sp. FL0255]
MEPSTPLLARLSSRDLIFFGVTVTLAAIWVIQRLFFTISYPSNLPSLGGRSSFSLALRWRYHSDSIGLYKEVYEKYSKHDKTVLVPGLGFHDDVILPGSALRWLQRQPERLIGASAAQTEVIQPYYGFGHDKFVNDPWTGMLNICSAMNDELGVAIDAHFGEETKAWKEISLVPVMRMIVAQAATRFILGDSPIGNELCRNRDYLKACLHTSDALIINAGVGSMSPKLLRPLLGRLGGLIAKKQIKNLEKYFEPEVVNLQDMNKRLCITNFGSMHQTSMQTVNMLLNILDSDAEFNTISILGDEVARVVGDDKSKGGWNKTRVAAMTRADSVARETLRLYAFGARGMTRQVVADGVVTEDGIALPKGSMVSFIAYWSHTDPEMYEDPFKYDPFRFSRAREAEMDEQGKPGLSSLSFVSTGLQNLAFSHGKHACPGRFLVDFELKMITTYILMNYDVELPPKYNGKRPQNTWVTEAYFPPGDCEIRVKRREVR